MSEGKKLVPKLRFPEFARSGVWGRKRLRDFLAESRISGSKGNLAKKITVKLWGGGVHAKNDAIQGSASTQYYRRSAGQFIYSKLDFLNQAFGLIPGHLDGCESTVDLPCFDFCEGLDPTFLLEYVKRKEFYEKVGEVADGSRVAKRIHAETFLDFPVLIPPLPEQQKIADCLSSLDELIAAQARKVDALTAQMDGLMQRLFPREGETQPRLRFPGFSGAGKWTSKELADLVDISSGSTPSKANPNFWKGSIPWVSAKDMKMLFLDRAEDHISAGAVSSGAKVVPPGTLLLLTRGMTLLKDVPICVLLCEMSFNQDVKALRPKAGVNGAFLALMLVGNKQRILKMVDIAGHGTGKLDTDELKAFRLLLPRSKEQQRVADFLISIEAIINAAAAELDVLKAHKKGLMQQLFPSMEAIDA